MAHSVRSHLRLEIQAYDETIRKWVPGYEEMLAVAAEAVASVRPQLVYDLGAGTGALSEALLEQPEIGMVELLDVDSAMLTQAKARLGHYGERALFTLRSYDEPFDSCDAMAASLSLHHVPSIEAKTVLFGRVFEALSAGGVLVNGDINMPQEKPESDALYRYWVDHKVARGVPEEEAWRQFEEWSEEDTYLPLDQELSALRQVGFEAECVWNDGPMVVVVARKPGSTQRSRGL